jgi:predicted transcriptional regulator
MIYYFSLNFTLSISPPLLSPFPSDDRSNIVSLATNLTVAWLTNPNVRANTEDATTFLQNIHSTLQGLAQNGGTDGNEGPNAAGASEAPGETSYEPAVTVRKSLGSPEKIISLIDGKPYSSLKRHLRGHGLTPDQYRERYGLKSDYPMVAPAYAERRREMAKKIGLGRKPGTIVKGRQAKPAAKPRAKAKA